MTILPFDRAFAGLAAIESRVAIDQRGALIDLSEQQLLSCLPDGRDGCSQGMPSDGNSVMFNVGGIVNETEIPYLARSTTCEPRQRSWRVNARRDNAPVFSASTRQELQSYIASFGPVMVSIDVEEQFASYKTGIYQCGNSPTIGRHYVLVVGYNFEKAPGYWIAKNS